MQPESNIQDPHVPLDALKRFLKLNHWQLRANQPGNLMVYEGLSDDRGDPIVLTLPIDERFQDTSMCILKVLELLSEVYQKPLQTIKEEILSRSCDFFRQRI